AKSAYAWQQTRLIWEFGNGTSQRMRSGLLTHAEPFWDGRLQEKLLSKTLSLACTQRTTAGSGRPSVTPFVTQRITIWSIASFCLTESCVGCQCVAASAS